MHCCWECKLVQPLWKTVWSFLKKLQIELPYDPAILLLGVYPKKIKTLIWIDLYNPMSIASLFAIGNMWKQLKCPLMDKRLKKLWYIFTIEYYSAIKRMTSCHLQQYGWPLRHYPKWNKQTERGKYFMTSPCVGSIKTKPNHAFGDGVGWRGVG